MKTLFVLAVVLFLSACSMTHCRGELRIQELDLPIPVPIEMIDDAEYVIGYRCHIWKDE